MPTIYVNKNAASITTALTQALNINDAQKLPDLVVGDSREWNVIITDGEGEAAAESSDGTYGLKVAIGNPGSTPIAFQDTWVLSGDTRTAELSTATVEASTLLGSNIYVDTKLEVELTTPGGDRITLAQQDIRIYQQVISGAALVPAPLPDYYTTTETLALLARLWSTDLIYVDAGLGTDTRTGLSAYSQIDPFATIAAAISAATSGDTILVRPGNYNEMLTLKNGVNLHFLEGATMIRTQTADGQILMKDNAVAVTCSITGRGVFSITGGNNGRILSLQAASTVTWEFKSATNSTAGFNFISLQDTASSALIMRGDSVTTSGGAYGIYTAQSSTLVATLNNLTGLEPVQTTATSKAWFFLQNGLCNGSVGNSLFKVAGSSECYIQANYIKTTGVETLAVITTASTAICSMNINRIESTGAGGEGISCSFGQMYGHVGEIVCSGGLSGAIPPAAVYIGLFVPTSAYSVSIGRIICPSGYGYWIEEGVNYINTGSCEADIPISIRDGIVYATGYYKCTTASKPAVEFVRSGATGTLIMNGGILEAGASSTYSITTTGAGSQVAAFSLFGTKINKPFNTTNITFTEGFYYNSVDGLLREKNGIYQVSAQFDKTNTTLANVTGLSANVAAAGLYQFEAVLFYDADATGGHKYAIAGTATATAIKYQIDSIANASNAYVINSRQTALAGSAGQAGSVAGITIIRGFITVNAAGTLTVQFAQNAANATSSILVGSYFKVTPF